MNRDVLCVRIQPVMWFAFIWCKRMIVYLVWRPLHFASRGYNLFRRKEKLSAEASRTYARTGFITGTSFFVYLDECTHLKPKTHQSRQA